MWCKVNIRGMETTIMPFRCKDVCSTYKDVVHKHHSYESGLITFCSPCQTLFLVKDTNSYRCVCCGSKTRSSPKTKSTLKVEKFRHE